MNFATEYNQSHKIDDSFAVTPGILDDFELFASQRGIQPSVGEWVREREWMQSRVRQEIVNQGLGVEKGDEVEAQRDPVIKTALDKIAK